MTKRSKIIYWISTIWLALGMLSTGIVQLLREPADVELMSRLSYPVYLLTILGVWKIFGVVAVLIPKFPLVKEWAYAGFFFAMSGAVFSHITVGHGPAEIGPPVLLLVLTVISWYFRPADRRAMPMNRTVNA